MENSGEILDYILNDSPYSPFPITYSFLAPNMKGFDNAMAIIQRSASSVDATTPQTTSPPPGGEDSTTAANKPEIEFAVFPAATETFTQKNLNCDIATSLQRFKPVIEEAKVKGYRVRAYISVVLGCPFEGYDVDPRKVAEMATDLLEMGADEIDLGDTTGMGTAIRTANLLRAMNAAGVRNEDIAMHLHDTYGQALVNTTVSLEYGIRTFDSSVGGLGGCPYSPGATGNVATEDMVYFMEELGMKTGINLDAMVDIGAWITAEIGKPNSSSVGKAVLGRRSRS
jgi:hydroxymethylglutaryl-CoA lyase